MKKARKEELLCRFPAVSEELVDKMKGKGAANYVVFLTNGAELFARCYHRYSRGGLIERQRYVFARDGAVRYGSDDGVRWSVRCDFREPVFYKSCMGYNYDDSYSVLNIQVIDKSDMRYSQYRLYHGGMLMCYLHAYCKHPNLEYLMKQGYDVTDEKVTGWWGYKRKFVLSDRVNWKSSDLLKMLNINKTEFKTLKGSEHLWEQYLDYREEYPKLRPADILNIAKVFKDEHGTLERLVRITGLTPQRVARYIHEQEMTPLDYSDYLEQCETLEYNIHDTMIALPHDFWTMHNRLTQIINYEQDELVLQNFTKRLAERVCLEFSADGLLVRQPHSLKEIEDEGRILEHCVGGYAERHAMGKLSIMFLRKASEPDIPYYTVEVSRYGGIVQCRGYKNNVADNGGEDKPQEIKDFEQKYQRYLDAIFAEERKERKTA